MRVDVVDRRAAVKIGPVFLVQQGHLVVRDGMADGDEETAGWIAIDHVEDGLPGRFAGHGIGAEWGWQTRDRLIASAQGLGLVERLEIDAGPDFIAEDLADAERMAGAAEIRQAGGGQGGQQDGRQAGEVAAPPQAGQDCLLAARRPTPAIPLTKTREPLGTEHNVPQSFFLRGLSSS